MNKAHHLEANQEAGTASKTSNCLELQMRICSVGHRSLGKDRVSCYEKHIHKERFQVELLIFIGVCLDPKCSSSPLLTETPRKVPSHTTVSQGVTTPWGGSGGLHAEKYSKDLLNQVSSAESWCQGRMHLPFCCDGRDPPSLLTSVLCSGLNPVSRFLVITTWNKTVPWES